MLSERPPRTGYLVNEVFYTLQGEGFWTGRPAVFARFSRCNLWTGREEDRAAAVCTFCDTDFLTGTRYTREELIDAVFSAWPGGGSPMVVFTGGEPTLQLDGGLVSALQSVGWYVAVETNGTRYCPPVDWVCVSPKAGAVLRQVHGDELKVVYPQPGLDIDRLHDLPFNHFWLSPMDGPALNANTALAVGYVLTHPDWRLSIQTHKVIGVR